MAPTPGDPEELEHLRSEVCRLTDEVNRLERDRILALIVIQEVPQAQRGIERDAVEGVRRWHVALRQLEEIGFDLEQRHPHDGHPIAYYFCELEGGHTGGHQILPHEQRIIHGPRQAPSEDT